MAYSDLQSRAFTQIAYMNLDEKYVQYCKANNTDSAPLTEILSDAQLDKLRNLGLSESDINSWNISGVHNTNSQNGFYACIIETSPGNAAVGFRGSEDMGSLDNVVNDWVGADIGLVNSTCTNQQEEVDKFLEKYKEQLNGYDSLAMAGHSLGGNLAEYATIVSYQYGLDDNIKQCVSMDGPGFSNEFINKYREQIEKMSGVMYHPRWSFVGTMLNDLPGVEYQYVQVSNDANAIDDTDYNDATRHDTKYLVYDENGKLVQGEQDGLSKITSVISEGVDHLPAPIGNALITIVGGAWIGFMWAKENMFDENGNLTPTGWGIVAGAVGIISIFGLTNVVMAVAAVVVAIVAVVVIAVVAELIYDLVIEIVDIVCDALAQAYNWAKEQYQQFKDAVVSFINKARNWFRSNFDNGYKYAEANPYVKLDTYKLSNYAQRLWDVNRRISNIDRRLDSLYWRVGLLDIWNLMQADILTGYSWRLNRCASYLNDTANDYNSVETNLVNSL